MAVDYLKETKLHIEGMHCASCVLNVEKVLKNISGIASAKVNLATGTATVDYDSSQVTTNDMKKAIEDIGFKVILNSDHIQISGMSCASCVEKIEKAVSQLHGVTGVVVNLSTGTARIEHDPLLAPLSKIKQTIRDLGYEVEQLISGTSLDREREARQREIHHQLVNMAIAWPVGILIMLGTFQPYWVLPNVIPSWMNNKVYLFP